MASTKPKKKTSVAKKTNAAAKKTNAAAKKTAAPTPAAPADTSIVARAGAALARLRSAWPALSTGDREAFRALATDAQRSDLGRQTKAEKVLEEVVRWAVQMDADLRAYPEITEIYSEARFAYFLERSTSLQQRMVGEKDKRRGQDEKVDATTSGRDAALGARQKISRRLYRYAGKREDVLVEINTAVGTIESDESLAKACVDLAAVAQRILARTDDVSRRLATEAGLTAALADQAKEAGERLTASTTDVVLAGRRSGVDSPAVNIEEGGVLLEMEHAMEVFAEAGEENSAVRRLVPGAGVRHALGYRKPSGAKEAEPAKKEPDKTAKEPDKPAKEPDKPAKEPDKPAKEPDRTAKEPA